MRPRVVVRAGVRRRCVRQPDAEHGYGAEQVWSVEEYFDEHDFTVNEVLIQKGENGWELRATTQAVVDSVANTIRPTIFEHNEDHRIGNKLALKALRLMALYDKDAPAQIKGVNLPRDIHGDPSDDDFMQALQLDKAIESGVAELYLDLLREHKMSPYFDEGEDVFSLYMELTCRANFDPSDGAIKYLQTLPGQSLDPSVRRMLKYYLAEKPPLRKTVELSTSEESDFSEGQKLALVGNKLREWERKGLM